MPKNDIGGFFVSLGLNIDKGSFDTGNKLIDNVDNSFNKLIGSARNAAVVLAGTAVATGAVETAAYKQATAIGISTEALDLWKASAKIAGVDANGLIGAMSQMANVMNHMTIDGSGLEAFSKQLGELGIIADEVDIAQLLNLSPDELMEEIIRKAQDASAKAKKDIADAKKALTANPEDKEAQQKLTHAQKENQRVITIVGDILGDAGQNFFIALEQQGKTIGEFLAGAIKTVFTTEEDNQNGMNFAVEVNTLKTELESIGKLTGDSIAGVLTPYVQDVNKLIQDNSDTIKSTVKTVAEVTDKLVGAGKEKILQWWDIHGDELLALLQTIATVTVGIAEKLKVFKDSKAGQAMATYANTLTSNTFESLSNFGTTMNNGGDITSAFFDFLNDVIYAPIRAARDKVYEGNKDGKAYGNKNKDPTEIDTPDWWMNDGIMRPDGTVTQVAPDDWVLAARDLGDLAQAFTPKTQQPQLVPEYKEPNLIAPEQNKVQEFKIPESAKPGTDTLDILSKSIGEMARSFIPQNHTSVQSAGEYTINQTFNISGGNDMPQVIKQQAYKGTQEGLLELMNQSSRRLQLMSGTR